MRVGSAGMLVVANAARDAALVLASLIACIWLVLGALGLAGLGGELMVGSHHAPAVDPQTRLFFGFLVAVALASVPPTVLGWLDRRRGLVLRPLLLAATTTLTSVLLYRIALLAAA